MNNIYLINDNFHFSIKLNFTNNTFKNNYFNDYEEVHNFKIISKDKIIIYWNKLDNSINFTLYTSLTSLIMFSIVQL